MTIHSNVTGRTRCNVKELHDDLERRLRRQIAIGEVARAINVDVRALRKWYADELTNYNGAILAALCHYYGVSVDELLSPAHVESGNGSNAPA